MRPFVCTLIGVAAGALVLVECAHVGHVDGLAVVLAVAVYGLAWLAVAYVWNKLAEANADIDRILAASDARAAAEAGQAARDDSVFRTVASVRGES